eukprot:7377239-Prymnesium_polylepis.3
MSRPGSPALMILSPGRYSRVFNCLIILTSSRSVQPSNSGTCEIICQCAEICTSSCKVSGSPDSTSRSSIPLLEAHT